MNTQKNMQSQPNTNLRLEQAVIAGLLVSPEAIFDVADRLQPDMFSDNRTGFVYRAVLSLMAIMIINDYCSQCILFGITGRNVGIIQEILSVIGT